MHGEETLVKRIIRTVVAASGGGNRWGNRQGSGRVDFLHCNFRNLFQIAQAFKNFREVLWSCRSVLSSTLLRSPDGR